MLMVLVSSVVSFGIVAFAALVMLREFQQRWPQILAALAFDPRQASAPIAVRRPAAPRQAWPAPVRLQPSRRAAA